MGVTDLSNVLLGTWEDSLDLFDCITCYSRTARSEAQRTHSFPFLKVYFTIMILVRSLYELQKMTDDVSLNLRNC